MMWCVYVAKGGAQVRRIYVVALMNSQAFYTSKRPQLRGIEGTKSHFVDILVVKCFLTPKFLCRNFHVHVQCTLNTWDEISGIFTTYKKKI